MLELSGGSRPISVTLPPNGVFVFESRHRPGFRMPVQRHDFLELFYVLEGSGTFHIAGRVCPCRRGDLIAAERDLELRPPQPRTRPLSQFFRPHEKANHFPWLAKLTARV